MYKEQVYVTTNVALVMDGLVAIVAGYLAYYIRWFFGSAEWSMDEGLFIAVVMSLMFINCYVLGRMGFYASDFNPPFLVALRKVSLAVAIDFSVLTLGLFFIKEDSLSRIFLGSYVILTFLGLMLVRVLFSLFFRRSDDAYGLRRILLIGNQDRVEGLHRAFKRQKSWGHTLVGFLTSGSLFTVQGLQCLGVADDLAKVITEKDIDEVVFAVPGKTPFDFQAALGICREMGLTCRIVPSMYNPKDAQWCLKMDSIDDIPALSMEGTPIDATGLFYKRLLDLVGGTVGFVLLCIMYVPIALAIKLESRGPVLFSQVRVGQNNRKFRLYKFRTMYKDAEERKKELLAQNEMNGPMFKMENDPRVTRVGRFLRKTSLDEFPQFINVMRGEMSLVGTRPPTVEEVQLYTKGERRRISMKPGVTGLWQVSGRNHVNDFRDVVRLDLEYIDGWRFAHDIQIVLKTIWVIVRKEGAS